MKLLYIFPHPDDESFGPACAINKQKRQGHEVHLLTLTKGGATKVRFKYDYSIEEMGEVRFREMLEVEKVLNLDSMKVLDLPDSGLKEMDPRIIEHEVQSRIQLIKPDVVITYPVHGISGFHDHLITHHVVKRVYLEMKEQGHDYLQRLAFFTIDQARAEANEGMHKLSGSTPEEVDCKMSVDPEDIEANQKSLACYKTYQEVIAKSINKGPSYDYAVYEFFQESFDPPVDDITSGLNI